MESKNKEELLENVRFAYENLGLIFASLEEGITMRDGMETVGEAINDFTDEITLFINSLNELKAHHGNEQIKYFVSGINI